MLVKNFLVVSIGVILGQVVLANEPIDIRHNAVKATVTNNTQCNSLDIFYWELGDKNGKLAAGWGGKKNLQMLIVCKQKV